MDIRHWASLILLIIIIVLQIFDRLVPPKNSLALRDRRKKLYLDTSVLMDARLMALVQTKILNYEIVILRSVLHELQLLADGADSVRRARARAGLDMAKDLRDYDGAQVSVYDDPRDPIGVDNRLLDEAKQNHATILTNDFNLKKRAEVEQIDAISLNELAMVLRNEHEPGETAIIQVTAVGSGANQGIGYLDDGTMVVIDQAKKLVGTKVEIELTRMNQANSGTIFFAKLRNKKAKKSEHKSKTTERAPKVELKPKKSHRRKPATAEEKLIAAAENQKD